MKELNAHRLIARHATIAEVLNVAQSKCIPRSSDANT